MGEGGKLTKKFHPLTKIRSEDGFFCAVIHTHLPTCALYVSTIVLLVLVPTYVHADMSATHENDTTLTGPKMGQERQMSPNVRPTFYDMSTTCHPIQHFGPEIADADIRQTQLSLQPPQTASHVHIEHIQSV
jgi:hypothetical protein